MKRLPSRRAAHSRHKSPEISVRIPRDFSTRSERERDIFTQNTWCDSCYMINLGMLEPIEYQLGNKIYLEGKCGRCGSKVISEIIHSKSSGTDEDIIWPIHDNSKPALTFLPKKIQYSFMGGPQDVNCPPSHKATIKLNPKARIFIWVLLLVCLVLFVTELLKGFIYGR